jgi:hypothetical protein
MARGALLLMMLGALAACSHDADPGHAGGGDTSSPAAGCTDQNWRIRWMEETAPVINKRQGQDALDSDDTEAGDGQKPCL